MNWRLAIIVSIALVIVGAGALPAAATWSIVGVDPDTGEVGVAVASCVSFEVTSVPVLAPGVGAAASQAMISAASGDRIVKALSGGMTASETLSTVVAADDDPESRQFGVVVLDHGGAGWTGAETLVVALDRRGADGRLSVQGNTLVSNEVVDAAITAAETAAGSLGDRLIAGLVAGADAGGDSRCGEQTATAAALLIARPDDEPYAFTDTVPFPVDPNEESVPSVFVSVLLRTGSERAPDRLAQIWSGVDQASPSIAIQDVEDGAATATGRARIVVLGLLGIFAVIGAIVVLSVVRSRRRAGSA